VSGRPRLLYVVTLAEVGGAQSYVRDLLPAVREQYDVTLAAHGEGPLRAAAAELGIAFVPLRHVRRPLSVIQDPLGVGELTRLLRRVRPDVVHLNSSKAGVLGRIAASAARVPVRVFTAHGWAFKATTGAAARVYTLADRAVCPLTTMIVCVSQTELEAGLAARVCVRERTTVIPNAVDVSALPTRSQGVSEPVEIVSVGRLAAPKDFSTLLAALALLPAGRARLTVLGDGPLRPALEEQVAELGLAGDVVLAGEAADVRPYLDRADLFVLSSTSEGMPISVLEAMAAGLPVVASAVGGLHEIVVDGATGFLVPPSQPQALADALGRLVEDAGLRGRLGAGGRQRAEDDFSLARWRAAHLDLYASLLAAAN
jgi:glycosyltransferase involved in cell wall biosynthesis